jgi:hypothetical protein
MPEEKKSSGGSGLSIQTLFISASAAVAAATIVPLFWQQGTVIATAMTPVIVALVSEALRKPVETVKTVAPKVTRRTGTGAAVRQYEPEAARTRDAAGVGARGRGPERFEPLPPHLRDETPVVRSDDPFGLRTAERRRPRLKIALVTGLLAFLMAAAAVTASELALFGGSVSGERGRTTLLGGGKSNAEKRDERQQEQKTDEEASPTATPEESTTPEATSTATPEATATVTPAPDAQTAPVTPTPSPTPVPTP